MTIIDALNTKRIYLDGGMGSSLIKLGYSTQHGELLNIEKPHIIKQIMQSFLDAGSDVLLTNTFNANSVKADLSKYSLKQIIDSAIDIASDCASDNQYVLYDCGPSGELLKPYGSATFEQVYDIFASQAKIVRGSKVDGVILETFSDLQELRAAILAFKEHTDLPILCSMSFEKNGRTFLGVSIQSFALTAQELGVSAIGINCGTGPQEMYENIKTLAKFSYLPIYAKANAGLPTYENGRTFYSLNAQDFAFYMKKIAEIGTNILGGCCGTDNLYIKELYESTKNVPFTIFNNKIDGACSYAKVVQFLPSRTAIIGERINPTNKPLLKEAIKNDDYAYILSMCLAQIQQNADILDINVGMAGIDEAVKLKNTIMNIQGVANVPICIDTSNITALENAIRITNGVCIINSVNGEEKSMQNVFPLAKKYGSYVIALCLDKDGIPQTALGRLEIAKRILTQAKKYGIDKSKLLFDPLTMAVSVDTNNAMITLDTIKLLKQELQVKTTLGLSNVSFGLPNREKINSTFYDMVLRMGTETVIINPQTQPSLDIDAKHLLLGKDASCQNYIEKNSQIISQVEQSKKVDFDIAHCVEFALEKEGMELIKTIANKYNYNQLINEIIAGLNNLGDAYQKGTAFLPQLMAGSDVSKQMLDYIKANFMCNNNIEEKATVVFATVKGDVHDIGKNIVKAVISNYGYRVIDLGKDVDTKTILSAIKEHSCQVVALSALMTTTLNNMTDTVLQVREKFPHIKIIVGGAIVSDDYAQNLNILYAANATECVKVLENNL